MKINICLVGNYIETQIKFDEFENLITHYTNTFKNYELDIYLVVWDTISLELKEKLEKICKLFMFKMPNVKKILDSNTFSGSNNNKIIKRLSDNKGQMPGGSIFNTYCMFNLRKKAMDIIFNRDPNSYTFLIRVDMFMTFRNINNWISKNTYHVNYYRCWREKCKTHSLFNKGHNPVSDQTSIGETKLIYNFYNMTNTELSNLLKISRNGETATRNRLKHLTLSCSPQREPNANNMHLISSSNIYTT